MTHLQSSRRADPTNSNGIFANPSALLITPTMIIFRDCLSPTNVDVRVRWCHVEKFTVSSISAVSSRLNKSYYCMLFAQRQSACCNCCWNRDRCLAMQRSALIPCRCISRSSQSLQNASDFGLPIVAHGLSRIMLSLSSSS